MKIYTSYFYKLRFMKPYMIPLSTALWDPKYFHDFKGPQHKFLDKNGVWNGLRATPFVPGAQCEGLCHGPQGCKCKPDDCAFLKAYYDQLCALDFNEMKGRIESLAFRAKNLSGFKEEPVIIFLFYEKPDNPCSERRPFQRWMREHGVEVEEWTN